MQEIARCESGKRQFDQDGNVLHGRVHYPDTGLYQINSRVWGEKAKELDLDIETVSGNIKMAKHILDTQGISAWKSSEPCWGRLSYEK